MPQTSSRHRWEYLFRLFFHLQESNILCKEPQKLFFWHFQTSLVDKWYHCALLIVVSNVLLTNLSNLPRDHLLWGTDLIALVSTQSLTPEGSWGWSWCSKGQRWRPTYHRECLLPCQVAAGCLRPFVCVLFILLELQLNRFVNASDSTRPWGKHRSLLHLFQNVSGVCHPQYLFEDVRDSVDLPVIISSIMTPK